MTDTKIRFDDGAAYEILMGRWSALVGERFLDWLGTPAGGTWVDVGCGNGAFTEQIVSRCAPAHVHGVDPSPAQLSYARGRLASDAPVTWHQGDATRLPVPDATCDTAAMALVLFFVPEPAAGVAEMCRAVRPGGVVASYHWDILGGGFPLADITAEMLKIGTQPTWPPSVDASTLDASTALWAQAGLKDVQTTQFTVQRRFDSFDDYWASARASNAIRAAFEAMSAETLARLKEAVRVRVNAGEGPLTLSARANAVRGVRGW